MTDHIVLTRTGLTSTHPNYVQVGVFAQICPPPQPLLHCEVSHKHAPVVGLLCEAIYRDPPLHNKTPTTIV